MCFVFYNFYVPLQNKRVSLVFLVTKPNFRSFGNALTLERVMDIVETHQIFGLMISVSKFAVFVDVFATKCIPQQIIKLIYNYLTLLVLLPNQHYHATFSYQWNGFAVLFDFGIDSKKGSVYFYDTDIAKYRESIYRLVYKIDNINTNKQIFDELSLWKYKYLNQKLVHPQKIVSKSYDFILNINKPISLRIVLLIQIYDKSKKYNVPILIPRGNRDENTYFKTMDLQIIETNDSIPTLISDDDYDEYDVSVLRTIKDKYKYDLNTCCF